MFGIIAGISQFYRNEIAPKTYTQPFDKGFVKEVHPLKRIHFLCGVMLATLFTIQKIALSVFFALAWLFTCGLNESSKASFFENIQQGAIYGGAISLGYAGAIRPQTINEKFLEIPQEGLTTYVSGLV